MSDTPYNRPRVSRDISPVLLRRERAAGFLDMSPPHFDKMVREGKLPPPRRVDANIRAWAVSDLLTAVANMPFDGEAA